MCKNVLWKSALSCLLAALLVLGTIVPHISTVQADEDVNDIDLGIVATIGSDNYTTLPAAISAVQAGETIILLDDVHMNNATVSVGQTVTIDLNGHAIHGDSNVVFTNEGVLTIKDTSEGQTGVIDTNYYQVIMNAGPVGTVLAIDGGTILNNKTASSSVISNSASAALVLNGGFLTSESVGQLIENGSNNSISYGSTEFDKKLSDGLLPAGYICVPKENSDRYIVKQGSYAAQIMETMDGYESLDAAVADIETEGTVKLLSDVSYTGTNWLTIPSGKTVTLDLNGFTLDGAANNAIVVNGTLTVKDSTYSSGTVSANAGRVIAVAKNGTDTPSLTITNGNFVNTKTSGSGGKTIECDRGTVTINGGQFDVAKAGAALFYVTSGGVIAAKSGWFCEPIANTYCADGFRSTETPENGYYTVYEYFDAENLTTGERYHHL